MSRRFHRRFFGFRVVDPQASRETASRQYPLNVESEDVGLDLRRLSSDLTRSWNTRPRKTRCVRQGGEESPQIRTAQIGNPRNLLQELCKLQPFLARQSVRESETVHLTNPLVDHSRNHIFGMCFFVALRYPGCARIFAIVAAQRPEKV